MVEIEGRGKVEKPKLQEVLQNTNLHYRNFGFFGGKGYKLRVFDPAKGEEGEWRKGNIFVTLPPELVEVLPGSVVLADEFLKQIGYGGEDLEEKARILESDYDFEEKGSPAFQFKDDSFSLTVYNGSVSEKLRRLSELAIENFDNPKVRAEYQKVAFEIIKQILSEKGKEREEPSWKIRILEDIIASGETIAGNLAALLKEGKLKKGDTIRIDVASATTQGLLVLKKFAEDNGLKLEIHVGALAYGLSEGEVKESGVRLHANYVTYPDEYIQRLRERGLGEIADKLEGLRSADGNVYVVGDMGDAFQSLPIVDPILGINYDKECPWNKFRKDMHGPRGKQGDVAQLNIEWEEGEREIHIYPNGGYFMRAAYFAVLEELYPSGRIRIPKISEIVAKRVWTDRRGILELPEARIHEILMEDTYGVLITYQN